MADCKKLAGDCSPISLEEAEESGTDHVAFHVGENTYDTVELVPSRTQRSIVIKNTANKKCLAVMSIVLVISLLLGVAVAIAFPLRMNSVISRLYSQIGMANSEVVFLKDKLLGHSEPFPVPSCASLPSYSPSGYYWVESSSGSAVHVYCDMDRTCGGVTGGWTRVANLDMSNNGTCPEGFHERSDDFDVVTCVRDDYRPGCSSVDIDTQHINFTTVCGMVVAYQFGSTHAFNGYNLESNYVDGVSLTYGKPRKHIWTFASALSEKSTDVDAVCPCINSSFAVRHRQFVSNDYFCDTGSQYSSNRLDNILYTANPLWDGTGCGQHSTCCIFNNPPWFYKTLPRRTKSDIEMRVCRQGSNWHEDIAIEEFYIYIQ